MSTPPRVSVAMPVFNGKRFLRQAVHSILEQSMQDWELILIDDGSTDGSVESIADLIDERFRIVRDGTNKGLSVRLNEAIDLARGRYFARMDGDDVAHPERFSCELAALECDPELDLVGSRCLTIDEAGQIVGTLPADLSHAEICARPWLGFYLPHPTWMGRIEWFRKHRYPVPAPYCCEDQELLLRSFGVSRFRVLPDVLLAYRLRSAIDLRKAVRTRRALLAVQCRHFIRQGRLDCVLLSLAASAGRIGRDWLRFLALRFRRDQAEMPAALPPGFEIPEEWAAILTQPQSASPKPPAHAALR